MDQFLLHLRLLNELLEKKLRVLTQILNITENQQSVITAGASGSEVLRLYEGMSEEKQRLIDAVIKGDRVFEQTYREIGPVFEKEGPRHAGLVKRMQEGIRRVTALDARIRVREARMGITRPQAVRAADNAARKRAVSAYERNKSGHKNNLPRGK